MPYANEFDLISLSHPVRGRQAVGLNHAKTPRNLGVRRRTKVGRPSNLRPSSFVLRHPQMSLDVLATLLIQSKSILNRLSAGESVSGVGRHHRRGKQQADAQSAANLSGQRTPQSDHLCKAGPLSGPAPTGQGRRPAPESLRSTTQWTRPYLSARLFCCPVG